MNTSQLYCLILYTKKLKRMAQFYKFVDLFYKSDPHKKNSVNLVSKLDNLPKLTGSKSKAPVVKILFTNLN